jgi:hypothetical protein
VPVTLHATIPKLTIAGRGGTQMVIEVTPGAVGTAAPAAPQIVNVNMPAGSRGVDVVRQIAGQARRSGRRFGAPVVSYARR